MTGAASNKLFWVCQFWPVVKGGSFGQAPCGSSRADQMAWELYPFFADIGASNHTSLGLGQRVVIEAGSVFSFELSPDVREGISGLSGSAGLRIEARRCFSRLEGYVRAACESSTDPGNVNPELVVRHDNSIKLECRPDLFQIPAALQTGLDLRPCPHHLTAFGLRWRRRQSTQVR